MKKPRNKLRQWLKRYIPAEILGTLGAVLAAWVTFSHTHSYLAATASGWVGEGVGFYGYFIITELFFSAKRYGEHSFLKRTYLAIGAASTNLLVEFVPAEVLDNFILRPFLMYEVPQHIHPYAVGFLVGKFGADIIFYCLAVVGYEARLRWLRR